MSYFVLPSGFSRPGFFGISTVANLRAIEPSASFAQGMPAQLVAGTQYYYDPTSLAPDNGTTVIKPNDLKPIDPGRWLQSTVAAVTGTGTNKTIPRWTAATTLGDSAVLQEEGAILTMFNLVNGAGPYTMNIQEVALNSITGTGSGATCALVVSGGLIRWLGIMKPGKGYNVGDTLQPNVAPFTATIQVQSVVSSQRGTTDYGTTGRLGAGTTEPTAGVDSRLGAQLEGWNRQAISLGPSPYEFTTPTTLRVGGLTAANVDYSNASSYYAQLTVARLSSSTVKTLAAIYANSVYETVTGASSATMYGGWFTASRLYPTDTATNVTMHGVFSQVQTQNTGGPYTIADVYGVRTSVVFASTGTAANVYDFFAGAPSGVATRIAAGNSLTSFTGLHLAQPQMAAGASIATFYGMRFVGGGSEAATIGTSYGLRVGRVAGTIATRWGISQEDDGARSQILGNVGLGVDPGAGEAIATVSIANAGAGYTFGIYTNVPLTNVIGTGSGATADIFVGGGGAVAFVQLRSPGQGYVGGTDVLSCASIGPGANFQLNVVTTTKYARAVGEFVASRVGVNTTNPVAPFQSKGLGVFNAGEVFFSTNPSSQSLGVDVYQSNLAIDTSGEVGGLAVLGLIGQASGIYTNTRYDLTTSVNSNLFGAFIQVSPAAMGVNSTAVYGVTARPYIATAGIAGKLINRFFAISAELAVKTPTGAANTFSEIAAVNANVSFTANTAQNVTYAYGAKIIGEFTGAAHDVNTAYSLWVGPFNLAGGATIMDYYGIFQQDSAAKNVFAANTVIGSLGPPTAVLELAASTINAASLRINSGVAPALPNNGDFWWDNSYLCFYNGSTTKNVFIFTQIAASSGAGVFTLNGPTNTIHADSTFAGTVGATQYTIGDIVTALKNAGVLAA